MIVAKNDGTYITKVSIVVFRKIDVELWIEGEIKPIVVPISEISTMA